MLCKFCQHTIFCSERHWGLHRESLDPNVAKDPELKTCTFCSHLWNHADSVSRYRWTIRRLPATREDEKCMTITFRPVDDDIPGPYEVSNEDGVKHTAGHFRPPVVFYLLKKDTITPAHTLPTTTAVTSSGSLPQIQSWIHQCSTSHKQCQALQLLSSSWLPTRLIDVSDLSRIHIITTHPSMKERYTTLSHCWGKIKIIRLIQSNYSELTDPSVGVRWDQLTKTFQDAITVTRALGIKYIWIDSLCIVQWSGEKAQGDFKTEGQLMHLVYRNSFLNIAAAHAEDGTQGLFKFFDKDTRDGALHKPVKIEEGGEVNGEWYVLPRDYWWRELLDKILYTRGWVFQERMLTPRIVHFSTDQVLWDCATLSATESLPHGLPLQIDTISATERHWRERLLLMRSSSSGEGVVRAGTADDSLESFWIDSVRNYTRCNLTSYVVDRLQAIWGVAKVVRDGLREEGGGWDDDDDDEEEQYASGLWSKNLYLQLAWRVVSPRSRDETRFPDLQKIHPSWSWASTIGEIVLKSRIPVAGILYRIKNHKGGSVRFEVKPPDNVEDSPQLAARGVEPKKDHQPELVSNKLAVKGMPVKGSWDKKTQAVRLSALESTVLKRFDFFPDVLMEEGNELCLLVLSAHETDEYGQLVGSSMQDDYDSEFGVARRKPKVVYNSGSGLIVEGSGVDEYKRVGSFSFRGLGKEDMRTLVDEKRERNIWLA
ncbi:heterokaryon incompatibility protein-domain-containing protein [Triangularia setosa]|uniref:Heterokaryon incompatibility protein-domain-containing protein n=1 Tax=Triangularia setosa TaxID=2587417 RepID=A0AAN6VZ20_9PEZI|nr:heterokaryon incompatibility protein-domain-containing protein [Podospora setosa]